MEKNRLTLELTVEEINFIAIYCGKTRTETLENIYDAMQSIDDDDMKTIAQKTADMLNGMSDGDFDDCHFGEIAET